MSDAEDYFLHGGAYAHTSPIPRAKMCKTCAFRPTGETVRRPDVTLDQLIAMTAFYDDFVCHTADKDVNPRCAAWHAINRDKSSVV